MSIDLRTCDQLCFGCVKEYKVKHDRESKFNIVCNGIPDEYIPESTLSSLDPDDAKSALSILDPVTWAAEILDWHCLDADGAIWKRKSQENTLPQGCPNFFENIPENEVKVAAGKSPFHRPYQAYMLRCTAKRKVFRIGRQAGKTETLIIALLFAVYTNRQFKAILIAPFQAQIELIFSRIEEHLNNSEILYNSKNRLVKAPQFTLELKNGSFIRAFTAGTQSKSNAGSARGQSAHMLVFDEADYLSDSDIAATLAQIANFPKATVWMSSTPSGKRERFYNTCFSPLYKHFYYPSSINPNWSQELDDYFKNDLTDIQYKHEILAEFGDIQEGVFQVDYVLAAKGHYTYAQMHRTPGWQYCVGVDWNDTKVGTTIVVTGFDPSQMKFFVVDREVVSREGWTQLTACQRIAEINRRWLPEWIYVDRGFGGTQYEVLRQYGFENIKKKGPLHVDSRLATIVKQYDFGSNLEIHDPFTKQPVKKASKPFLVENAMRRFETRSIFFASNDKQLEAELLGYVIDHITSTGLPVYKQGNEKVGDHNLDALMLSLVSFTLEMTSLGKPTYMANIVFSGRFGEKQQEDQIPGLHVKQDPKYEHIQRKAEQLPLFNRTGGLGTSKEEKPALIPKIEEQIPGAHLQSSKIGTHAKPQLWSWPGFEKDTPRPKPEDPRTKFPLSKLAKPSKRNKI